MSALGERIEKLEQAAALPGDNGPAGPEPVVEFWIADNGRDGTPPGRYPMPGSNVVMVIYDAEELPPADGDPPAAPPGCAEPPPTVEGRATAQAVRR